MNIKMWREGKDCLKVMNTCNWAANKKNLSPITQSDTIGQRYRSTSMISLSLTQWSTIFWVMEAGDNTVAPILSSLRLQRRRRPVQLQRLDDGIRTAATREHSSVVYQSHLLHARHQPWVHQLGRPPALALSCRARPFSVVRIWDTLSTHAVSYIPATQRSLSPYKQFILYRTTEVAPRSDGGKVGLYCIALQSQRKQQECRQCSWPRPISYKPRGISRTL